MKSNKNSPRLYRNIRIQHGHPLNVYDKVSVFVLSHWDLKFGDFMFQRKKQTTLSRSGFLPRTTQNYNIIIERETFVYVFEQKYLEEMKNEKFSVLDKIKEITKKDFKLCQYHSAD